MSNSVLGRFYLSLIVMSCLLTNNPVALRFLMSETIFNTPVTNEPAERTSIHTDANKEDRSLSDNRNSELLFWGSNERNILFIIENPDEDYFSAEAEDAFLKTLTALKLNLKDVAIINQGKDEKSFAEIKKLLNPKVCIYCEGEKQATRNIFNRFTEHDEISFLHTYSFEEMLTDTNKKRGFWNAIKGITVV